jgi:fructosamine-3-kinase
MTKLFGSSNNFVFYKAYDSFYPLPIGYEQREIIYNLYHILNHYVLFGGGYMNQANYMIEKILKF